MRCLLLLLPVLLANLFHALDNRLGDLDDLSKGDSLRLSGPVSRERFGGEECLDPPGIEATLCSGKFKEHRTPDSRFRDETGV